MAALDPGRKKKITDKDWDFFLGVGGREVKVYVGLLYFNLGFSTFLLLF